MIREIEQGSRFERFLGRLSGLNWYFKEYDVPENLDHTIKKPGSRDVRLVGPKDNFEVIFVSSNGSFPLSAIAPEGTTFGIDSPKHFSVSPFSTTTADRRVLITPKTSEHIIVDPAFALTHEVSHIWAEEDEDWINQVQASEESRLELSRHLSQKDQGANTASVNEDLKIKIDEALMVIRESEFRASAIALYIIGRLIRDADLDILPRRITSKGLTEVVNWPLSHHYDFPELQFTVDQVEGFLTGNLWVPGISIVAEHLDHAIPKIEPKS